MSEAQPRYVPEGEAVVFPVGEERFYVHGPCYVSPNGRSIYFPDGDIYMNVPRILDIIAAPPVTESTGSVRID